MSEDPTADADPDPEGDTENENENEAVSITSADEGYIIAFSDGTDTIDIGINEPQLARIHEQAGALLRASDEFEFEFESGGAE